MDLADSILRIFVTLIALKAVTIGSDFNFFLWFRDGKKYSAWYKNRETYSSAKKNNDEKI